VISSDWNQKKGTMLAGGDIPDLIIGRNGVTDAEHKKFMGLFQELTELIETEAPNVQKMFEEEPITKRISTDADGEIYGISKKPKVLA
jgi:putative aldouronate transport system substrate-binding protein